MTTTGTIVLRIIGLAMGVALTVPGSVLPTHAESRITADVKVVPSRQPLTDEETRAISFSAGRILVHVDQAKQDLAKQEKSAALTYIDKAISLAKIIEQ